MFKPFKFESSREINGQTLVATFDVRPLIETGYCGRIKVQQVRVSVNFGGFIFGRFIQPKFYWVPVRLTRQKFIEKYLDKDLFWSYVEADLAASQES